MVDDDGISRRLRGGFGNALVWGVGWSALWIVAVVAFTVLGALGIVSGPSWGEALGAAVRFGIAFGIIGFVAGGVFSGVMGLLYRGRRLAEISWLRVGIGGGIFAGLFVPLFLQAMNLASGDGLVPWELVLDDGLWTAVFGSVVAGGSIKLAQLPDRLLSDGNQDDLDRLPTGDSQQADVGRRP